jgi:exonuclease SbcC
MRILALRGHNLASLAEPFAIDLEAEPLAGAGLFAITGETGAGKSTLLDALCLALYGDFPRIAEGSDQTLPDVGVETIKAKDPRNILRRGAARGSAEVDFVGLDGARYRATWSVNRARGRADGRLQAATRLLVKLAPDGEAAEPIAEKTAVTAAVEALTDLTFDQFRRTVVLAQGEFDAFLAANEAERADLLEKITGTEIYARLSREAFDVAKAAREAVERARERLAAVGVLEPAVRDEKLARRDAILAELATLDTRLAAANAALALHDRRDAARTAAADADARAANAAAEVEATRAERMRLSAIGRAATLRPVFDRLAAARRAEARAVEALDEAKKRLELATPLYGEARTARDAANAAVRAVVEEIEALKPAWTAAAALDERILGAARAVAEAETPAAAARQERDEAATRLRDLAARRADVVTRLAALRAEAERRPAVAALVDAFDAVDERLVERASVRARRLDAETRRTQALADATAATEALAALDGAAAARREERTTLEVETTRLRGILADLRMEETAARDAGLARLAAEVAALLPVAREAAAATTLADRLAGEADAARAEAETAATTLAPLVGERETVQCRLAEGEAARRLADALDDAHAAALRETLVEGAPCPVCGATDHPILTDPSVRAALEALRAERRGLEARLSALDGEIADLDRRRSAAETRRDTLAAHLADARGRKDTAGAALAAAEDRIAALRPADGLDPGAGEDRWTTFAARIEDARAPLAEARARADATRLALDAAGTRLAVLDRARDAEAPERTRLAEAAAEAERRRAVAETTIAEAAHRIGEIDARLALHLEPLDLGPADLDTRGDAIRRRLHEVAVARRTAAAEAARLAEEEQGLERDALVVSAALERAERALATAEATLAAARTQHAAYVAERAGLLDGVPTAIHREERDRRRAEAEAARDRAVSALDAARREHDEAITRVTERKEVLIGLEEESSQASTVRDHALAAADLDLAETATLLAVPAEEVETLAARLRTIDEAARAAATEAAARRRDLFALEAEAAETADRAVAAADLASARTLGETLNRELGALGEALSADDEARRRAGDIESEIAGLTEEAAVHAAVEAAIGSADGAKFRRFAQGITLDRLAALADRHLATLAPRYRLQRTEGLGLAIVDRDMGDETRSTRSLSGGERFLASLALALALSGLEGRRGFVDTLFVDEGFGSLDAATLDVAIDALESLQSEGRRVGVISHVPALQRRVPVQIRIRRAGLGRSRVEIDDGRG